MYTPVGRSSKYMIHFEQDVLTCPHLLTQFYCNVGPASQTLVQHCINIVSLFHVCCSRLSPGSTLSEVFWHLCIHSYLSCQAFRKALARGNFTHYTQPKQPQIPSDVVKWEEVFGGYLPFDVHRVPPTDPSSSKREMNCTNKRTRDGVNGKLRPFVNPTIKKCRVIIDITYFSDTLYTQRDAMDYNRYFKVNQIQNTLTKYK